MTEAALAARTSRIVFRRATRYAAIAALIAFAFVYLSSRPHQAGPLFSDFHAYYAGGWVWDRGGAPYGSDVWRIEQFLPGVRHDAVTILPFVAPPASLLWWGALGALPYEAALGIWVLVLIVSDVLVLTLPSLAAGVKLHVSWSIPLTLLAVTFGPLIDCVVLGQPALPAVAAVMAAVYFAARERWGAAAAAALVVALMKPNIALVLLATVRGRRSLLAYGAAAAVWLALNVLCAGGLAPALHYLSVLHAQTASESIYLYQFTLAAVLHGFGASVATAETVAALVAAAAIAAAVGAIVATRARPVVAAAIACAAWPFVTPYLHEPDFALMIFPGLLLAQNATGRRWVLAAVGLSLVAANPFALAEGRAGVAFATVSALVAATQLAVFPPAAMPLIIRSIPMFVAPLVMVVGLLGPRDELPMWPAAVPAHFWTPASGPAAAAWLTELRASSLLAIDPWAALLRLLTLLAVACLLVATIDWARELWRRDRAEPEDPIEWRPTVKRVLEQA